MAKPEATTKPGGDSERHPDGVRRRGSGAWQAGATAQVEVRPA